MKKKLGFLLMAIVILCLWGVFSSREKSTETRQSVESPLTFEAEEETTRETLSMELASGRGVTVSVTRAERVDRTVRYIDADCWNWDLSEAEQLAVADFILSNCLDYGEESLADLPEEVRLSMGFGPVISAHSYVLEDGSYLSEADYVRQRDAGTVDEKVWSCYLNVTDREESTKYLACRVAVPGYLTDVGGAPQAISLSAQNTAAISDTAVLRGTSEENGIRKTLTVDSKSNQVEGTAEGCSTGVRFVVEIRPYGPPGMLTRDLDMTAAVEIRRSSVGLGEYFDVRWSFASGGREKAGLAGSVLYG